MKKLLVALIASLVGIAHLTADDCVYSTCCTECFGFESALSFDVGGGYRQDNIQWNAFPNSDPAIEVQEKWKELQMGIVETNGQFLACEHYLLKADFDFGWFNNKNGKQTIKALELSSGNLNEDLKSRTKGRMYDVSGAVGYQFNWCCYRYAFTPLVGYSYHYQKLKNDEYINELLPDSDETLVKNRYIYRWRGPTLGFTVAMQASCDWQIYFTYNYHWLRFHGTSEENFIQDAERVRMKLNNAGGNEFVLGTTYQFSDYWFFGIKVDYKCFSGNKGSFIIDATKHREEERFPMRKLKWDSLFATIDIGVVY